MNHTKTLTLLIRLLTIILILLLGYVLATVFHLNPFVTADTTPNVPRPVTVLDGYAYVVLQDGHGRTFPPGTRISVCFGEGINTYVLLGRIDKMITFESDQYLSLNWTWLTDPFATPTITRTPTTTRTPTPTRTPTSTVTPPTSLSYLPLVMK